MSTDMTTLPGQETLLACWSTLAQISPGARVIYSPAAAAVFPAWAPLNNAIVLKADDGDGFSTVASEVAGTYAEAGIDVWALWVPSHSTDLIGPDVVRGVDGLKRDTTTLVMQATIPQGLRMHDGVVRTSIAAATRAAGDEPIREADLPEPDMQPGLAAWVMVCDDLAVAGSWSFLHESDCGIYAVGTLPEWRRRGVARALVEHVLADAGRQGARTATLQSTPMGQHLYQSLGFEPAGRYEEWIPQ